jgi:hypothetical protein
MELDAAVLFGEVTSVVPIGESVVAVGVYVDAMLPKAELSAEQNQCESIHQSSNATPEEKAYGRSLPKVDLPD